VVAGAAYEYVGAGTAIWYEGIVTELVASGATVGRSGAASMTGAAVGTGAGAAGGAFLVFFLGFFLPIAASGAAQHARQQRPKRSQCQSSG